MKKYIVYIFFLFYSLQVHAQEERTLFELQKQADSIKNAGGINDVIRFYKRMDDSLSGLQKIHVNFLIAQYLEQQGKWPEARERYLALLDMPGNTTKRFNDKPRAVQKLYQYALANNQFSEALTYLRWLNGKHRFIPMCGTGGYERKLMMQYEFFTLYEKLGQTDSALMSFTPYVFEQFDLMIDTADYIKMVDHYYCLLLKKNDACKISADLQEGMKAIKYELLQQKAFWSLECSFIALGSTIYINSPDWGFSNKQDYDNDHFKKENLVNRFKQSYGYQLMASQLKQYMDL